MAHRTRSGQERIGWVMAMAVCAVAAAVTNRPVQAADSCDGYTWNVAHERALFASPATSVMAAFAAGPSPALDIDRLYDIALTPQNKVSFVLAPAKKALADGAFAGLVTLHIPSAGKYRVSISDGIWIDVIAAGEFTPTDDFTGVHECRAPRKIVQYSLPAGDMVLQLSNTNSATVRVAVTAASK